MNFVVIMTDTQNRDMVGAYGAGRVVDTPNLDRLAARGVRFDRAYTTCPLCTAARSGIFSGTHPTVNGAWCNNVPPYSTTPLMGQIFAHYGYRTGYTGKWHLDGSGYFGDGEAGGGFSADWWYDGKRYAQDVGTEKFRQYRTGATLDREDIWGHRVVNRAIDFLKNASSEPFLLVVSFDEPHGPYAAPQEFQDSFDIKNLPKRPNFGASTVGKPQLQQIQRKGWSDETSWDVYREKVRRHFTDNAYIDREIGRVLDAVDEFSPCDTTVIYTSDHGDMQGSHGLKSKGPMMYEEITNVPLIIKTPEGVAGTVSQSLASHLDILPTMLDLAGISSPESLQGVSLRPIFREPTTQPRRRAILSFSRFAINHDDWGEFYPIRCITDGRYKLAINLLDSDEFYDLQTDPYEMTNLLHDDRDVTKECAELHDALLAEMDRIRDPFRSYLWGERAWRVVRKPFYYGGKRRNPPGGFPFQPVGIEADGTVAGQQSAEGDA